MFKNSRKILIIEESEVKVNHIKNAVNWIELGYKIVDYATNGVVGLEKAQAIKPDIIFLNDQMSFMNTHTLIQKTKERGIQSSFVILSDGQSPHPTQHDGTAYFSSYNSLTESSLSALFQQIELDISHPTQSFPNMQDQTSSYRNEFKTSHSPDSFGLHALTIQPDFKVLSSYSSSLDSGQLLEDLVKRLSKFAKMSGIGKSVDCINQKIYMLLRINSDFKEHAFSDWLQRMSSIVRRTIRKHVPLTRNSHSLYFFGQRFSCETDTIAIMKKQQSLERYAFFLKGLNFITAHHIVNTRKKVAGTSIDKYLNKLSDAVVARDPSLVSEIVDQLFLDTIKPALDFSAYAKAYPKISILCNEMYEKYNICKKNEFVLLQNFNGSTIEQSTAKIKNLLENLMIALEESIRPKTPFIVRAIRYIETHFHEDLSLDIIAQHLNVNKTYLSHRFKSEIGENLVDYIKKVRIDNAKNLITLNDEKIYQIAYAVGFESPRYFSTVFKELTGITPLNYRKKNLAIGMGF